MADDTDNSAGKKRRIIHWNPDADAAPPKRRWTPLRIAAWSVGGFFALLFAAGIVVRVIKLVAGPEVFHRSAAAAVNRDPNAAFISETKAEFAHETVGKALAALRKLPLDHPRQREGYVAIEKEFIDAEAILDKHDYAEALNRFNELSRTIDEFSLSIRSKQEAQQLYDTILVRIKDLDRARSLAPDAFEAATTAAGTGRQFLNDGSFLAAKKVLDGGMAELTRAENLLKAHIQGSLVKGQEALANGQREEAIKAFNAALEKSPGNEVALQGLKRAETIERVHALLVEGEALEKQGQYAPAAEAYRKAFALDQLSALAQAGQARALRLEKETRFNNAFSAAQTAFKQRDWSVAIAECENALKVYPKKPEVETMLKSAKENAHTDAVKKSLAKAYEYEKQHQWLQARDAYNETMKLEPDQADAREGHVRAGTMIRALLQFDKLIESAEQLASHAEFQAAIRRFNDAMAVKPSYLDNSDRVQRLHELLMAQNKPVDVTFQSDGKTWVSISNYRLLGQMTSTTLKMMPGDYEVIGRRKGYQDVVMLLQVRNGTTLPAVTVACQTASNKS
jgi:tetratricopeptide (TPR) repeat protein